MLLYSTNLLRRSTGCRRRSTSIQALSGLSVNEPHPPQHRMSPPPPPFCVLVMLLVVGFSVGTASSQRVDYLPGFTGKLPFHLETGYIGVGKSEEIQTFYYFVESERSPKDDPLILWLQGGPRCSGFSGLVFEIVPLPPALLSPFTVLLLIVGFSAYTASSQSQVEYLPGFTGKLPFQLETGYIGLGESEEIQLFYYFIPSERNPEDDPLILWLQGGPGCSGLSGLVFEAGPVMFDYGKFDGDIPKLIYNPNSWTKVANVIFIDQPVGTGFSYTNNAEAYKINDTLVGKHVHEFILKWIVKHPKYLKHPLYVVGESYCGIMLPLAVNEIYNGIDAGIEPRLNMKGYMLGNPITDNYGDYNGRVYYAYRMGLLSEELYQSAKENCNGNFITIDPANSLCMRDMERVNQCIDKIFMKYILEPYCDLLYVKQDLMQPLHLSSSYEEHPARILQSTRRRDSEFWCRALNYLYSTIWANVKLVQEALHVREGTKPEWIRHNRTVSGVSYTYNVDSTVSYHKKFTYRSDCRALIFSGDHDMGAPHTATEEWISSLKLHVRSLWRPWFVEGQIAGYTTAYSNGDYEMTYATVKGGGHTAPEYKPKECLYMLDKWLRHEPL